MKSSSASCSILPTRRVSIAVFLVLLFLGENVEAVKERGLSISPPATTAAAATTTRTSHRPQLVQDALENNKALYYFGLGSNMSRKKLENRSSQGKIRILRMEPAVVKGHRLAFNMRGFPPLEPGMGSLEPVGNGTKEAKGGSKALVRYEQNECHGALVKLRPEDYERVMLSEGVSNENSNPKKAGYEEIVVTAHPYGRYAKPVQAVALRARPHVRLSRDPCPSQRYMDILQEGAAGLGLKPDYQDFLASHPVQETPVWLRKTAVYNIIMTMTLSVRLKARFVSRIQSWFLFLVYVPSNANAVLRFFSNMATFIILLPGATAGCLAYHIMSATGTVPPFVTRMIGFLDPPASAAATVADSGNKDDGSSSKGAKA